MSSSGAPKESAKGAKYDSQGQARSASALVSHLKVWIQA